jgi:hypothetical protein
MALAFSILALSYVGGLTFPTSTYIWLFQNRGEWKTWENVGIRRVLCSRSPSQQASAFIISDAMLKSYGPHATTLWTASCPRSRVWRPLYWIIFPTLSVCPLTIWPVTLSWRSITFLFVRGVEQNRGAVILPCFVDSNRWKIWQGDIIPYCCR